MSASIRKLYNIQLDCMKEGYLLGIVFLDVAVRDPSRIVSQSVKSISGFRSPSTGIAR